MGNRIIELSFQQFAEELETLNRQDRLRRGSLSASELSRLSRSPEAVEDLPSRWIECLWCHYQELFKWNPRLSLVGPGTSDEVVRRHYWESLAGLDLLNREDRYLVDVGSGGGFPGWVLSAVRPDISVRLVEPREKKWVFLKTTTRKAGLLSCEVLNARVEVPLPRSLDASIPIDVITSRALTLPVDVIDAFFEQYPKLRILLWVGKEDVELPSRAEICRERKLLGGDHRRIIEVVQP